MLFRAVVLVAGVAQCLAATTFADQPNPTLNPNPTDTTNPRLVGKAFPFADLPEQVDTSGPQTGVVYRGPQAGYNICNSTTEGPNSQCQTLIVNNISDFCIWAPPTPDSTIGDTEGIEVAWCTQPTHGARLIPPGTFTGLQYIRTDSYVELTGELDQTMVNIAADDGGGELDSGGQDSRGNPLGGAVYSNNLPSTPGQITQSRTWSMFIGNGIFCFKLCDQQAPDALGLCQHIYDTIGCNYNVPASYVNGSFLSCEGDDQDPVGIYTGADGQISTFQNPPEGVVPSPPYTPRIPASSNCITYQSTDLFAAVSTSATTTTTTTASGASRTSGASGTTTTSSSSTGTSTAGAASKRVSSSGSGTMVALIAGAAVLLGIAVVA